jgi:hypothetical protein
MFLEYYLCEKLFSWEADLLKEVTVEYFTLRKQCEELFPDCVSSTKPKVTFMYAVLYSRRIKKFWLRRAPSLAAAVTVYGMLR